MGMMVGVAITGLVVLVPQFSFFVDPSHFSLSIFSISDEFLMWL